MSDAQPRLVVSPATSRIDQPLSIRATGVVPGTQVRLTTSARDGALKEWVSEVTFLTQADGSVDLERDAPLAGGSYGGVDPFGPLWSMTSDGKGFFVKTIPTPITYTFALRPVAPADDDLCVTATAMRHFGHDVTQRTVRAEGVMGTLFHPTDGRPRPGVVVLGGSDGGTLDHAASLLADEGYAVLALAYFGVEDRPAHLNNIELDQIDSAIRWLVDHPMTRGDQVALIGLSRGAELALQVACDNRQVGLVVAGAPSALRQPGLSENYTDFSRPAWVRGGQPLPFNPSSMRARDWFGWMFNAIRRRPMRQVATFRRDLKDPAKVDRAAIPVEGCVGPIVLVSGLDDQLWPSAEFADLIGARLDEKGWQGSCTDTRLEGVGHFVCFPYALPTLPPMTRMSPTSFFSIDFGGEAVSHAAAAWDTWRGLRDALTRWVTERDQTPAADPGRGGRSER